MEEMRRQLERALSTQAEAGLEAMDDLTKKIESEHQSTKVKLEQEYQAQLK